MRLCHLQRPICITLLLALSGCAIPAAYIPLASAALGFAAAEVGVLPALASDYLCYKGHAAECAPGPGSAAP